VRRESNWYLCFLIVLNIVEELKTQQSLKRAVTKDCLVSRTTKEEKDYAFYALAIVVMILCTLSVADKLYQKGSVTGMVTSSYLVQYCNAHPTVSICKSQYTQNNMLNSNLQNYATNKNPGTECVDSDAGKDQYFIYGNITYKDNLGRKTVLKDQCITTNTILGRGNNNPYDQHDILMERICTTGGAPNYTRFTCPGRCLNGACEYVDQTCGNGIIEGNEECDGADLEGKTCESLTYPGGTLVCTKCKLNISGCKHKEQYLMKLLINGQEKFDLNLGGVPLLRDDGMTVVVGGGSRLIMKLSLYDANGNFVTSKENPISEPFTMSYPDRYIKMDQGGNIYMFGYDWKYYAVIYKYNRSLNFVKMKKFDKITYKNVDTDSYCEIAKAAYASDGTCKTYDMCLKNKTKGSCPSVLKSYGTYGYCVGRNTTVTNYCKNKNEKIELTASSTSYVLGDVDDKYVYVAITDQDNPNPGWFAGGGQNNPTSLFVVLDKDLNIIKNKSISPLKGIFRTPTGYQSGVGIITYKDYGGRIDSVKAFKDGVRLTLQTGMSNGITTTFWIKKDANGGLLNSYETYFGNDYNDPPWQLLPPGKMFIELKNYSLPRKFGPALKKVAEKAWNEQISPLIMDVKGEDYLGVVYHANQQESQIAGIDVLYPNGTIKASYPSFHIPSCYYPPGTAKFVCNKDGSIYFTTYRARDPKCQ